MQITKHPLHPALVHFPVALWTAGLVLDLTGLATADADLWPLSFACYASGAASGAIAMLAGFFDLASVARDHPARDTAAWHMLAMSVAWLLFAVDVALRGVSPRTMPTFWALAIAAVAFLVMAFGAWLGGRLVYRFGVGVQPADRS